MTPDEFRTIALSFRGASESAHMRHPDFRVNGRIFATLGYPDTSTGMVKLPMEEQQRLVSLHPGAFYPATGAWGLRGCTMVHLDAVKRDVLAQALDVAWQQSAASAAGKPKKDTGKTRG